MNRRGHLLYECRRRTKTSKRDGNRIEKLVKGLFRKILDPTAGGGVGFLPIF